MSNNTIIRKEYKKHVEMKNCGENIVFCASNSSMHTLIADNCSSEAIGDQKKRVASVLLCENAIPRVLCCAERCKESIRFQKEGFQDEMEPKDFLPL